MGSSSTIVFNKKSYQLISILYIGFECLKTRLTVIKSNLRVIKSILYFNIRQIGFNGE